MKKALSMILAILMVLSTLSCLSIVSFAADAPTYEAEVEPNDTSANAQGIEAGKTYLGNSNTYGDVDWYKITNEKDYFELTFKFDENSNMDGVRDGWNIYLYRLEDLNSAFASKTVTTSSWTSAKFPYTGEIYVKVQPKGLNTFYAPEANSYYNIGVTTTQDVLWENEINDSTEEANVIKNGTKYIGASQTCVDVDWYKLENRNGYVDIVLDIDYDKCSAEQVGDGWSVYVYSDNDFTTPVFKKTDIKAKTNLTKIAIGNYAYIKVQPDALNNNYYAPEANCYYDLTVTHTPATPKVTSTNAIGGVQLSWNKIDGATKYVVYRRQGGSSTWVNLGTTTGTSFLDKNVKSGVYYCYTVRAFNSLGKYSEYISANTSTRKYMATPKLTTIYNHQNGLAIKWNAVAGVTNGYRVYRRGAGSTSWTYLGTTKNLYFIDSAVKNKNGEYFRYTVIADGGYHSKFDTTGLYLRRLANPTLNSATSTSAGITVKWGKVAGSSGYYVYRKTANSTWTRVGVVSGVNNLSYLDKTAKKGTTYTYTVRAVYGSTLSAYYAGISCKDKY